MRGQRARGSEDALVTFALGSVNRIFRRTENFVTEDFLRILFFNIPVYSDGSVVSIPPLH